MYGGGSMRMSVKIFLVAVFAAVAGTACFARPVAENRQWTKTVDFGGEKPASRIALDLAVPLDLRAESGISFDIECSDWASFSSLVIYFKSGNGWYRGGFEPKGGAGR